MIYDPVFIVGMPRSGTKLLRSLLNRHSKISISDIETEFFFFWVNTWKKYTNIKDYNQFLKFYYHAIKLPYFTYRREAGQLIKPRTWYDSCRTFTVQDVYRALLMHDTQAKEGVLWGDKSPSYITRIEELKKFFPTAKFIHIVRDVRDYCLSINHAWNKNMYRAAQRWVEDNQECIKQSKKFKASYTMVTYEDLISNANETMKRLCSFLQIKYCEKMIRLENSVENIGQAKGTKDILKNNMNKYLSHMSIKQIRGIEDIAGPLMQSFGYSCSQQISTPAIQLNRFQMLFYQVLDGINFFIFERKERGITGALKYCYRYYNSSGNRLQ